MRNEVDAILMEALLIGASSALQELVDELGELRRGWVIHGADPQAVEWLDGVIAKAGWWGGRLAAGSSGQSASSG
jgi:hypothetical protein